MMKLSQVVKTTVLAGIVGVLTVTAGAVLAEQRYDGVTLRVGTWGGSWKANMETVIVPKFEALGGKIEFVTGSPQSNLAKLIAGRGRAPFDIMETLDAQEKDFFTTKEFIQMINLDLVPNVKYLQDWQYNEWRVAPWHTQEAICYNKDKFAELGIARPTTYTDLIHPKLAGRLSIPDITSGGGLANVAALAYAAGGDELNVKPGLELIKKLQVFKFWSRGGEVVTQMETGDVYAALMHAGWCVRSINAGQNNAVVHPKIGKHVGVNKSGWLVILKSSEVRDAASWFMNAYLDPQFQVVYAKKSGVVPTNSQSFSKLKDDPVLVRSLQMSPEEIGNQLVIDYSKVNISDWNDQWNRAVTSN